MARAEFSPEALKRAIKEALVETLGEKRDFFRQIVAEALEDFALVEAIEEGRDSERMSRDEVFELLKGTA